MATPTGYLLDTNILVSLIRGNALGVYIDSTYSLRSTLARCTISVVTVGEMLSLTRQFGWGTGKVNALKAILDELVWVDINTDDVLDAYAEVDHYSDTVGRSMGKNDAWIAATAKVTKVTLLTSDKDFDHLHGTHVSRIWIDPNAGTAP
jgi:tRNA(fMet)-specific endonuclease VapC